MTDTSSRTSELALNDDSSDSITGLITRIEPTDFGIRILVEEDTSINEPREKGGQKIWYGITDNSDLFILEDNNTLTKIGRETLKAGQIVEAQSTGVILTSYPAQTGAKQVIVIE